VGLVVVSEIFPLQIRGTIMGLAIFLNRLVNALVRSDPIPIRSDAPCHAMHRILERFPRMLQLVLVPALDSSARAVMCARPKKKPVLHRLSLFRRVTNCFPIRCCDAVVLLLSCCCCSQVASTFFSLRDLVGPDGTATATSTSFGDHLSRIPRLFTTLYAPGEVFCFVPRPVGS